MPKNTAPPKPRRKYTYPVPRQHHRTARMIYWALVYGGGRGWAADRWKIHLPNNVAMGVRIRITRLCKLVGVDDGANEEKRFENALRELRRREVEEGFDGSAAHRAAAAIGETIRKHGGDETPRAFDVAPPAPAPSNVRKFRPRRSAGGTVTVSTPEGWREGDDAKLRAARLAADDYGLAHAGIMPGDVTVIYETGEISKGDVVYYKAPGDGYTLGRYRPAPGGRMRFETVEDEPESFVCAPGDVEIIGRVVHVERAGEIVLRFRPIRDEQDEGTEPSTDPATATRIKELRARLRGLLDEGKAHNESGVFRIRRELYELENGGGDEWPRWIGGVRG